MKEITKVAVLTFLSLTLFGCTTAEYADYPAREVVVSSAPPPVVVEHRTTAPATDYVWVEGAWVWRNRQWQWERGHWVRPPRYGAHWIPGRYYSRDGRQYYVPGHWER